MIPVQFHISIFHWISENLFRLSEASKMPTERSDAIFRSEVTCLAKSIKIKFLNDELLRVHFFICIDNPNPVTKHASLLQSDILLFNYPKNQRFIRSSFPTWQLFNKLRTCNMGTLWEIILFKVANTKFNPIIPSTLLEDFLKWITV